MFSRKSELDKLLTVDVSSPAFDAVTKLYNLAYNVDSFWRLPKTFLSKTIRLLPYRFLLKLVIKTMSLGNERSAFPLYGNLLRCSRRSLSTARQKYRTTYHHMSETLNLLGCLLKGRRLDPLFIQKSTRPRTSAHLE